MLNNVLIDLFYITISFIIYFTLPETQGKTLTQLKNIYDKKRKDDYQKIEKNNN